MVSRLTAFILGGALLLAQPAFAGRSAAERLAFKRANPCPSSGERRGACPGHVVDHINPLCNGGPDRRENMQWQTVADAKRKDADERRLCRQLRRP
jgi:hypothetical protein